MKEYLTKTDEAIMHQVEEELRELTTCWRLQRIELEHRIEFLSNYHEFIEVFADKNPQKRGELLNKCEKALGDTYKLLAKALREFADKL